MTPQERVDAETMLSLAILSYRGFEDVGQGVFHVERLRQALRRGFRDRSSQPSEWDLAWGPVAYRAAFSTFDDSVVYVARRRGAGHQYVIAIRGTNPVSAFDWILGDFWSAQLLAWPYGDAPAEAQISLSTALGLSIIQHMRSPAPPNDAVTSLWRQLDSGLGQALREAAAQVLRPIESALGRQLRGLVADVRNGLHEIENRRRDRAEQDVASRVHGLLEEWHSDARRELFRNVSKLLRMVGDERSPDLLRLLEGGIRLRNQLGAGQDLLSFLRVAVEDARGPIEVVVTGHSKGGALAPTVALWLADTQGRAVDDAQQWDPHSAATVRCVAFAGPTAGNAAFARHSDEVIGAATHRIANRLDIVPHAWSVDGLGSIAGLWPGVHDIPLLDTLVEQITEDVGPLRYRHIGRHVTEIDAGAPEQDRALYFDQFVYQHLDAYLRNFDIPQTGVSFIGPLA